MGEPTRGEKTPESHNCQRFSKVSHTKIPRSHRACRENKITRQHRTTSHWPARLRTSGLHGRSCNASLHEQSCHTWGNALTFSPVLPWSEDVLPFFSTPTSIDWSFNQPSTGYGTYRQIGRYPPRILTAQPCCTEKRRFLMAGGRIYNGLFQGTCFLPAEFPEVRICERSSAKSEASAESTFVEGLQQF